MGSSGLWIGVFFLSCFTVLAAQDLPKAPTFGDIYHVSGILSLPYAEIREPFEAWYNLSGKVSRIEYYDGQVTTLQNGFVEPAGVTYKISPETTETEINVIKCFQLKGTPGDPVVPQSVFPDMQGFQHIKEELYEGQLCNVWQKVVYEGRKKNTYTFWVANSVHGPIPVHYQMKGYNTLLRSHYDKYEVDYTDLHYNVDPSIFKLPKGEICGGFPGHKVEHGILANPMRDLVSTNQEDRAHRVFEHYKEKFDKDYDDDEEEHERRKTTFVHNMRYIHSMNRAKLTYKMEINHLADRTTNEMASMSGRLISNESSKGRPFPTERYVSVIMPPSMDWRLYGAVTPVKDQAVCGSCWSFSTTGVLEGALFLKTGDLILLSQQMLVDCTWGFGNLACDGGREWQTFEWVIKHGGVAIAESYGPYLGENGYCHYNDSTLTAKVKYYTSVTTGATEELKMAIFKNGPVSVGINAGHRSFRFYSSGVYYEPACKSNLWNLNHAVLAVGYGTLGGEPYWLIKNSWSTYWGNDGYILMSMKDNNCGVATDGIYVTLE